jgi:hypothetical protein
MRIFCINTLELYGCIRYIAWIAFLFMGLSFFHSFCGVKAAMGVINTIFQWKEKRGFTALDSDPGKALPCSKGECTFCIRVVFNG